MKPLETQFRADGFNFTQVKRLGDVAIFAKKRANWVDDCATYEVVRIQKHRAFTVRGSTWPATEAMPRADQWGTHGWSYQTLAEARARFSQLTDQNPSNGDTLV